MAGRASRYLAGLCVAALALVAGGWLVLTPYAFGFRGRERLTGLATGVALVALAAISLACWSLLWRRRLRADGVLAPARSRKSRRSERRQAKAERLVKTSKHRALAVAPDPAQVLTDLRDLLNPLLADQSLLTDSVVVREECGPAAGDHELAEPPAEEPAGHLVQAPGQLRGSRSASFLTAPVRQVDDLLQGAELLVAGTGEEESW